MGLVLGGQKDEHIPEGVCEGCEQVTKEGSMSRLSWQRDTACRCPGKEEATFGQVNSARLFGIVYSFLQLCSTTKERMEESRIRGRCTWKKGRKNEGVSGPPSIVTLSWRPARTWQ